MASPEENPNWVFDLSVIDDVPVPGGNLPSLEPGFHWPHEVLSGPTSMEHDYAIQNSGRMKEGSSRKRVRCGPSSGSDSKAQKEKIRRDRLNDRFQELSSLLDPGRSPKVDKAIILSDAACMVIQLRDEAQKLKESYESLQEKVNELKIEKNELRDEKLNLRAEKERVEQQLKVLNTQPGFLFHPSAIPPPFAAPPHFFGNKLMPFVGCPGTSLWNFTPAAVDTSEDHVLHPPVA